MDNQKSKSKIGCLLIHGWTSSPAELESLKNYLNQRGVVVSAPILPGHGTRPDNLNNVSWEDWVSESERELGKLRQAVDKVFVGGVSLGGNIAFILAHNNHVDGIVSMGTPIFLNWEWGIRMGLAVSTLVGLSGRLIKKRYPAYIDRKILIQKSQYWAFPPKSVGDVFKAISRSKKALPNIKAPTLIIQSKDDHLVKPETADYIYERLGSSKKDLIMIDQSYHVFILDKKKAEIFEKINQFIEKITNENRNFHQQL